MAIAGVLELEPALSGNSKGEAQSLPVYIAVRGGAIRARGREDVTICTIYGCDYGETVTLGIVSWRKLVSWQFLGRATLRPPYRRPLNTLGGPLNTLGRTVNTFGRTVNTFGRTANAVGRGGRDGDQPGISP